MFTCSRTVFESDCRHSHTWNIFHQTLLSIQSHVSIALLCGLHFQTWGGQHPPQRCGARPPCWRRIPQRSVVNDSNVFLSAPTGSFRWPWSITLPIGLQTFESPGAASNQAQEPEATPEAKEEQKGKHTTCWVIHDFVLQKGKRTGALSLLWSTCVPRSFLFLTSVRPNKGSAAHERFPHYSGIVTMTFLCA